MGKWIYMILAIINLIKFACGLDDKEFGNADLYYGCATLIFIVLMVLEDIRDKLNRF